MEELKDEINEEFIDYQNKCLNESKFKIKIQEFKFLNAELRNLNLSGKFKSILGFYLKPYEK